MKRWKQDAVNLRKVRKLIAKNLKERPVWLFFEANIGQGCILVRTHGYHKTVSIMYRGLADGSLFNILDIHDKPVDGMLFKRNVMKMLKLIKARPSQKGTYI